MEFFLIFCGIIFLIAGLIGCILPVLPGPPLSYTALLFLEFSQKEQVFSKTFLIIFAVLTIFVTIIDYILPVLGAKWYGASKKGIWGSIIGMLIGLLFFPPVGMIIGVLIGAVVGELMAGKENSKALKAGVATFIAAIAGIFIKFSLSIVMTFCFIIKGISNNLI